MNVTMTVTMTMNVMNEVTAMMAMEKLVHIKAPGWSMEWHASSMSTQITTLSPSTV